ncbi:hypothetical protein K1719_005160 [Acacia pycnantha]|nr:hypothetical protein K1719_005160 [Acacia pycnantha]
MAAIELDSKISLHVRSNSFPSSPHPLVSQFEEHLKRLKSSESATTSACSLSQKLTGLPDLHEYTDKLLQLNITQQVLAREFSQKWVDELLDRSLRLLDICSTTKDCLLQSKEHLKEIQKVFGNVKEIRNEFSVSSTNDMLSLLKEAEEVTVITLESLLRFISKPKGQLKKTRWSTISKLMQLKRVVCESQESEANEFQR